MFCLAPDLKIRAVCGTISMKPREGGRAVQCSRETRIVNTVCAVLVLLGGAVRLIRGHFPRVSSNILICALFVTAAFLWLSQVRRRLVQPQPRRYLSWTAGLVVFLMLIRTVKFVFLPDGAAAGRYVWYLYYFPLTFMALLLFMAVLHIGRPGERPISRRWKLLYIPAALLALGILTNDLHQLAFRFPEDAAVWSDSGSYTYGPLYYAAQTWITVLFSAMLAIALARCTVPENRRRIWMPLVPLAAGAVYLVFFLFAPESLPPQLFKVAEVISFVFPAFMEGLILAHLFPSNDSYEMLWSVSNLGGGLMDSGGEIRCRSAKSARVTPEQVRRAAHAPTPVGDGNVLLTSRAVSGGLCYWLKDISRLNAVNARLTGLGDVLAEENAMLEGENALAEKRVRIERQIRLYDSISRDTAPQLEELGALLAAPPEDEDAFERTMKHAAVLMAYVKRRSNLLLLSCQRALFGAGELRLCLNESLEYLRLYGLTVHGEYEGDGLLPAGCVLAAYSVFEAAVEAAIPGARALLLNLEVRGGATLRMELSGPRALLPPDFMAGELAALGGTLELETEESTAFITLRFPEGGADA